MTFTKKDIELMSINRMRFEGFKKYFTKRPHHFKDLFKDMTIREAFDDTMGWVRKIRNGETTIYDMVVERKHQE